MITHRCSRHIGDRVAALAYINGAFQRQRRRVANVQRADIKDTRRRIVSSLRNSTVGPGRCQTRRQKVRQRNIGGLSSTIVGDNDLEGDRIAFGRCTIATGKCFHGHQIRFIIDNDGLTKIVTGGAGIRLIAHRGGRDIGDRVAALADIDGAF